MFKAIHRLIEDRLLFFISHGRVVGRQPWVRKDIGGRRPDACNDGDYSSSF